MNSFFPVRYKMWLILTVQWQCTAGLPAMQHSPAHLCATTLVQRCTMHPHENSAPLYPTVDILSFISCFFYAMKEWCLGDNIVDIHTLRCGDSTTIDSKRLSWSDLTLINTDPLAASPAYLCIPCMTQNLVCPEDSTLHQTKDKFLETFMIMMCSVFEWCKPCIFSFIAPTTHTHSHTYTHQPIFCKQATQTNFINE